LYRKRYSAAVDAMNVNFPQFRGKSITINKEPPKHW